MEWTGLNILSSPQVDFPPSVIHTKIILLKNSPAWWSVCCMDPFFNVFSISTCIRAVYSWLMCRVWGTLPSQFLKFLGICKYLPCFNFPASGKFRIILAENKYFTHGWTFLRSFIGIIRGKNMLKVSFVFIFTLESTAPSSCWAVVSVKYFLPRLPTSFVDEEFRMPPSMTPPRCLWSGIPEGLLFFLAFFSRYFNGLFFI